MAEKNPGSENGQIWVWLLAFSISSVMNLGRCGAYVYCGLIMVFTYEMLIISTGWMWMKQVWCSMWSVQEIMPSAIILLMCYWSIIDLQLFRCTASDSVIHTQVSFFRFFSTTGYYKILNIAPCAHSRTLLLISFIYSGSSVLYIVVIYRDSSPLFPSGNCEFDFYVCEAIFVL